MPSLQTPSPTRFVQVFPGYDLGGREVLGGMINSEVWDSDQQNPPSGWGSYSLPDSMTRHVRGLLSDPDNLTNDQLDDAERLVIWLVISEEMRLNRMSQEFIEEVDKGRQVSRNMQDACRNAFIHMTNLGVQSPLYCLPLSAGFSVSTIKHCNNSNNGRH